MIVTCPVCSTRYLVDPRALGATGRLVRCASCAHTWRQAPPEDAPRRVDLTTPEPEAEPPPLRATGRTQLPALAAPPRTIWSSLGWVLYAALIILLIGGGLWIARERIVGYWPAASRFYAMLGLAPASAQSDLELSDVATSRDTENGLPTLVIQGKVVNVSKLARAVPKLKVILQDGNKKELQSWSFTVSDERLPPGASVPFRTSVAQPSEAATGVVVTFDAGG